MRNGLHQKNPQETVNGEDELQINACTDDEGISSFVLKKDLF